MTSRIRRRCASTIRLLAIVLFALALLLRPVVDSVSELHEFAHGGHGSVEYTSADTGGMSTSGPAAGEGRQAASLHSLLSFVHCCGTTLAALPAVGFQPLSELQADAPAGALPRAHRVAPLISPFRPPITA
jgi:hypothetical protein